MWNAEKIKNIRLQLFMSQQEFAAALGVSFNSVNRWEQGKYTPTYSAQKKLAEICKKHNIKITEEK